MHSPVITAPDIFPQGGGEPAFSADCFFAPVFPNRGEGPYFLSFLSMAAIMTLQPSGLFWGFNVYLNRLLEKSLSVIARSEATKQSQLKKDEIASLRVYDPSLAMTAFFVFQRPAMTV